MFTERLPMPPVNRQQILAAIHRAPIVYPGPIGELLAHEFTVWADFRYRFGGHGVIHRAMKAVLTTKTS